MSDKVLVTRASMPGFEEYIEMIQPLWNSHWITNMGTYHKQLEEELTQYLEVEHVSLFSNGHMALELCIQSFDFPDNSEVITTPYTFISTTHAIVRNNLKPVFCDIKPIDFTIDETKIEALITEKTVAILPVHIYGNICNVEAIDRIAKKYNLKVIYDAAHAFGEKKDDIAIGNFGDASVFSFHATKVFNTIEGGAVVFKDEEMYKKLYFLKNFGIKNEEEVVGVGANAKMNEFQAAMGLCNLRHIDEYITLREKASIKYEKDLQGIKGISFLKKQKNISYNYSYFPIFIDESEYGMSRDSLYEVLKQNGIYTRKYFYPMVTQQTCYKEDYGDLCLENAYKVSKCVLILPLFAEITDECVNRIISLIRKEND